MFCDCGALLVVVWGWLRLGRMLNDFDKEAQLVGEDELLSELMDDEGAVDKAVPDWAVAKPDSPGLVEVVTVYLELSWAGSVEVLFLLFCRWHSAFHVRREI